MTVHDHDRSQETFKSQGLKVIVRGLTRRDALSHRVKMQLLEAVKRAAFG